jgi:hypothetical protein
VKFEQDRMAFRWKAEAEDFNMPVKVRVNGKAHFIFPTAQWKSESLGGVMKENWQVATDLFYVEVEEYEQAQKEE